MARRGLSGYRHLKPATWVRGKKVGKLSQSACAEHGGCEVTNVRCLSTGSLLVTLRSKDGELVSRQQMGFKEAENAEKHDGCVIYKQYLRAQVRAFPMSNYLSDPRKLLYPTKRDVAIDSVLIDRQLERGLITEELAVERIRKLRYWARRKK